MNDRKLNILRAGDQNFWAYYWITQEHKRYTSHIMNYAKHDEINLRGVDALYIHSPDITNYHAEQLPLLAKEKGIKVIGAYAGNPLYWSTTEKRVYSHADLIVTISPQTYSFAKFHYTSIPTIYMPECVDTNFFTPKEFRYNTFIVGWAGGQFKKIKRFHLTKELNYPIIVKDNWEKQRQSKDKNLTLAEMRDFYQAIDVLIITSESECQPRVVMEAMACSIPVIATDVGSMRMLLDKFQIVDVDPNLCVDQINEKLRILQKFPAFRQEIGIQNRLYINRYFSWKSQNKLWDSMFENVYNNKIDECIKNSENYLQQFEDKFTSKLLKFETVEDISIISTQEIFNEIISIYEKLNIKYCVINETCKSIILNNTINDGNKLYFGCNLNEEFKQELFNRGYISNQTSFKKYNTIIQFEPLPNQIKTWKFENKSIKVPYPLIDYLKQTFGNSILNDLKSKGYIK